MCRIGVVIFSFLYVCAVAIFLTGVFGWFGAERDALSVIYLFQLGLPWIWMVTWVDERILPWLAVVAPSVNLGILVLLCRWWSNRRRARKA